MRWLASFLSIFLIAAACSSNGNEAAEGGGLTAKPQAELVEQRLIESYGPVPDSPTGPLSDEVVAALDEIFLAVQYGDPDNDFQVLGASGDPRVGWFIADLLRFFQQGDVAAHLVDSFETLTRATVDRDRAWPSVTDHLIAWDVPAPPNYLNYKRPLYLQIDPRWEPFFTETDRVDWRLVSWGGVRLDDSVEGTGEPCLAGCIPAIDDPPVTSADEGDWYPDDAVVFGVTIDGESRAYPKNQMEVHEMVNDTLGGRRIGMPYCTLCGSAQVYFTDVLVGPDGADVVPDTAPVLRTSGLLMRSNKMMFDLNTFSLIDTFTGEATSGPLAEDGISLAPVSVVTTTWADWKSEHPDTTILAQDGGIGRDYDLDPLRGRDDNGPIFPIGAVDPRLGVQAPVLGVLTESGEAVAFPVAAAREALVAGDSVEAEGVVVSLDGEGLRASFVNGTDAAGHQAFWFAWSQFYPETDVWSP